MVVDNGSSSSSPSFLTGTSMTQKVAQTQTAVPVLQKKSVTMDCVILVIPYSGTNSHQKGKWFSLFVRTLRVSTVQQNAAVLWASRSQGSPSSSPSQPPSSWTPQCFSLLWGKAQWEGTLRGPRKTSARDRKRLLGRDFITDRVNKHSNTTTFWPTNLQELNR